MTIRLLSSIWQPVIRRVHVSHRSSFIIINFISIKPFPCFKQTFPMHIHKYECEKRSIFDALLEYWGGGELWLTWHLFYRHSVMTLLQLTKNSTKNTRSSASSFAYIIHLYWTARGKWHKNTAMYNVYGKCPVSLPCTHSYYLH